MKIKEQELPEGFPEPPEDYVYVGLGQGGGRIKANAAHYADSDDAGWVKVDETKFASNLHYALHKDSPLLEHLPVEELPYTLTPQDLEGTTVVNERLWPESSLVESLPGPNTKVWNGVHIREGAEVGDYCNIGDNVYIDTGCVIKDKCKIGNGAQLFSAAKVGEGCFIGPGVMLLNDKRPRAVDSHGEVINDGEWKKDSVVIGAGSSIGAGAIIAPGVTIGDNATVGMGSRVNRDIPDGGRWRGDGLVKDTELRVLSHYKIKQAVDAKDYGRVISLAQELLEHD